MTSQPNPSNSIPPRPTPTSVRTTSLLLPLLIGATILSSGCYQRVVKDTHGSYIGDVHEGNLPDDTRGFWVETFDSTGAPVQQTNPNQGPSQSQQIYDEQLKAMELQYRNSDD